jgi:hypothetical protein
MREVSSEVLHTLVPGEVEIVLKDPTMYERPEPSIIVTIHKDDVLSLGQAREPIQLGM